MGISTRPGTHHPLRHAGGAVAAPQARGSWAEQHRSPKKAEPVTSMMVRVGQYSQRHFTAPCGGSDFPRQDPDRGLEGQTGKGEGNEQEEAQRRQCPLLIPLKGFLVLRASSGGL